MRRRVYLRIKTEIGEVKISTEQDFSDHMLLYITIEQLLTQIFPDLSKFEHLGWGSEPVEEK